MCGILAVITKLKSGFTQTQVDLFSQLLYIDQLRGEDSTGVVVVTNTGNVELAKSSDPACDFIRTKEYDALTTTAYQRGWLMYGHNRKATRGTINDENAHPFWVDDNIILIHNGTLMGHKDLKDTEVDSHAIAHAIAESDSVAEALQKVNGAYALMWYNVKEKTMNIIRNDQRPLHWLETEGFYALCSEAEMLQLVANRNNLVDKDNNYVTVHTVPSNRLLTLRLKDDKSSVVNSDEIDNAYRPKTVFGGQAGFFPQAGTQSGTTSTAAIDAPPKLPYHTVNKLSKFQWEQPITYREYTGHTEGNYTGGSKVYVEVQDWITDGEVGSYPNHVFLTGKVVGSNYIGVFPVLRETFQNVMAEPQKDPAVFEIVVNTVHWRKDETVNFGKPVAIENIMGRILIEGRAPLRVGSHLAAKLH